MAWVYQSSTDELVITYGEQDRPVIRTIESDDAELVLDPRGDTVRVRFQHATRRCDYPALSRLHEPPDVGDDLRSVNEAADALRVRPYALRHELLAGGMPAVKIGGVLYVKNCVLEFYREILELRRRIVVTR